MFSLAGCASNNFTIDDVMMEPILEEVFPEMENAIKDDWKKTREKPSALIYFCYDERYGENTVTVISNWIRQRLTQDFVNSKNYKIIDSEDLERLRNEKKFQRAGYVDDKVMVDEGRELGGNYEVITKISKYNTFDSRIVNIETKALIYSSSIPVKDDVKVRK